MKYDAILISGTPASGKDTLSDMIFKINDEIVSFTKHKGTDSKTKKGNYHYLSLDAFKHEIEQDKFIQYHARYGNYYGIHKEEIQRLRLQGKTPLIHVGKYENLKDILSCDFFTNPFSLLIFVSRNETQSRLESRHRKDKNEIEQRLMAYDEEISQLKEAFKLNGELCFHTVFENEFGNLEQAANELLEKIQVSDNSSYVDRKLIEHLLVNG